MSPKPAVSPSPERSRRAPSGACAVALVCSSLAAVGCAPALPTLAGSRTTPADRADLALAVSGRVPIDAEGEVDQTLAPGGLAPLGMARWGLDDSLDLALVVAGASGRLELRYGEDLGPVWIVAGLGAYGGYTGTPEPDGRFAGEGGRAGALVPVTIGYEVLAILEVWAGLRAGLEYASGHLDASHGEGELWSLRAGGVLGFALGFRRVHVLAELAVDAEHGVGEGPSGRFERTTATLTPTFGVRVRL